MKKWGRREYWGVSAEFDPEWLLTEEQKKLRDDLIELCRVKIRPLAPQCDRNYVFPRESLDAMAELGLLGLIVPKELGGLGATNTFMATVVETLARYGCANTAMVYCMHLLAVSIALFRYHNNPQLRNLLSRLDKDKLVGTVSSSDPATGGHFWYPLSSKAKMLDSETLQLLKFGSWVTSAGHADWYIIQTVSPKFEGNYSDLSTFLMFKDEVRASNEDWSALGMHGNMSGAMVFEGKLKTNRVVGKHGEGQKAASELVSFFIINSSACWVGIALACMDVAKKHVTRKAHADVGLRVSDYPTIQDYFGKAMCDTSSVRGLLYLATEAIDKATHNCDWSLYKDEDYLPRSKFIHWLYQVKYSCSRNVSQVSDKMLHACGGAGYKTELNLERLLRDGKAGWVMAPTNEVVQQIVGKMILDNPQCTDFWEQQVNERVLHHETKKMSVAEKKKFAMSLLDDVKTEENKSQLQHPFQETDFDNPFNTCPPAVNDKVMTVDGESHAPALRPDTWLPLSLKSCTRISNKMAAFVFSLPRETDHTGCLPGQYIAVRVTIEGKEHQRYYSPVSRPDNFGIIELVLRFESQGIISDHFKALKPGDKVDFRGPCGGFEYLPNMLDTLTLLASGGGVTPAVQLIRSILNNPQDKTKINLIYFSENYGEIMFREELNLYKAKDERLTVLHTLGEAPECWEGEEGFIDTQMIQKYVTMQEGTPYKVVMCGGPIMTISCLHSLRSLGCPSHHIYLYGQFGTQQVKSVYGTNVKLSSHCCDSIE